MSTLKTNNIQHVDLADPSILLNSDGSVSIAGTVSYEDATNVDSVGVVTARKQLHVGTGVSIAAGGLNVTAGITTVQALQATSGTFSADSTVNSVNIGKGANSVAGNTVLGQLALDHVTTGGNNTALGYNTLTANTTGTQNTAVGSAALDANTTGLRNTGIGADCLTNNTTGESNVAVGRDAMFHNSTGSNNTAVGRDALQNNSTADSNTAVGESALEENTTGTLNTAVGHLALTANTTANRNTALGRSALATNTTGDDNVAVGYYALTASTTSSDHTAVGNYAFASDQNSTVSASNCTVVGRNAGQSISSGVKNTLFGYYAGAGIQNGATNVCIGPEAGGTGQITSADNQLYIARNNTSANHSNTWIYGDGSGNLYQGNNSSTWSQTSDIRLKKDIVDSPKGLNEINQLRVTNFYYREEDEIDMSEFPLAGEPREVCLADEGKGGKLQTGLIAQEIEKVWPECIIESVRGVKTVDSDPIQWAMIKAIQELSAKNDALEARIKTLEG